MPTLNVLAIVFEQILQWKFGVVGAAAAVLFTVGVKIRSEKCLCIAVVVIVLLFL